MGGMQALEWAVTYPDHVLAALPIATTARHSAQQIAFNEVGRQAIMADPDWLGGDYYDTRPPARGLAVARMVGHITYMSDESMREKFGRRLRSSDEFEVESYLKYRGYKFVDRFGRQFLHLHHPRHGRLRPHAAWLSLPSLFKNNNTRFLVISFTSDWLYPSYQSARTRQRLTQPQLRCRLREFSFGLRARRVSGRSEGTNGPGARVPGQHP